MCLYFLFRVNKGYIYKFWRVGWGFRVNINYWGRDYYTGNVFICMERYFWNFMYLLVEFLLEWGSWICRFVEGFKFFLGGGVWVFEIRLEKGKFCWKKKKYNFLFCFAFRRVIRIWEILILSSKMEYMNNLFNIFCFGFYRGCLYFSLIV